MKSAFEASVFASNGMEFKHYYTIDQNIDANNSIVAITASGTPERNLSVFNQLQVIINIQITNKAQLTQSSTTYAVLSLLVGVTNLSPMRVVNVRVHVVAQGINQQFY